MDAWIVWLVAAALLAVGEVLTLGLVVGMVAVGALAGALVGARALVLERVDLHGGRVKIGGEVWSARAYDETQVIEAGQTVEVLKIEGATALVYE